MPSLLEFTQTELAQWLEDELGEKRFRSQQIFQWLWQKLARDFAQMSNVSQQTRQLLAEKASIPWPKLVTVQKSQDATTKFLLEFSDGARVETVLIPSEDHTGRIRWTQCLSSQIGCPMACTFCATGQSGFTRNMTAGEILSQVLIGRDYLGDTRPDHPIVRNLVFMGMGEPLMNTQALLKALAILNDPHGLAFSPRRITVSTCGIKDGLEKLGQAGLSFLAVSLHAPNQAIREKIMPRAAKLPLKELLTALRNYPLKNREHITFEYLLLRDVNDSPAQAHELAKIVHSVHGKLNLIVYNATNGPYQAPSPERVLAFEKALWSHHLTAIVRQSKGQDIDAACGQLKARFDNG
ncbi:MAG: 23S rRNA (adenine(2503)-C(2))-methyltransferase RlmN [Desulfovibrio sp.]|nr:23S rRNA (adenine(2503)-C(2))-methyltransferase RlmN [Desulfovibrio sp.]